MINESTNAASFARRLNTCPPILPPVCSSPCLSRETLRWRGLRRREEERQREREREREIDGGKGRREKADRLFGMRDRYVRSGGRGGTAEREQSFHGEWREIIFGSVDVWLILGFGRDRVPCLLFHFEHAAHDGRKGKGFFLEFRRQISEFFRECEFLLLSQGSRDIREIQASPNFRVYSRIPKKLSNSMYPKFLNTREFIEVFQLVSISKCIKNSKDEIFFAISDRLLLFKDEYVYIIASEINYMLTTLYTIKREMLETRYG